MKDTFSDIWEMISGETTLPSQPQQTSSTKIATYPTFTYPIGSSSTKIATYPTFSSSTKINEDEIIKKKKEIKRKLEILQLAFSQKLENDAGFIGPDAKLLSESFIELLQDQFPDIFER